MSNVTVSHEKVAEGIYMLQGSGGNIGLNIGEDGAFMIDDQFAPLTEKIIAEVKTITDDDVRFLVNTHHHGDHTGGNENMGKRGAIIVAHDNVRTRLNSDELKNISASSAPKLPIVTFTDELTFHMNGHTIQVIHVPPAHTDGDAIIFFQEANVFHMGDTFFNGRFPYIDLNSGGNVGGLIAAGEKVLSMSNGETKIIPGHGSLATTNDLEIYLGVVRKAVELAEKAKADGMSADQAVANDIFSEFPAAWGSGFMSSERFLRIIFDSLEND